MASDWQAMAQTVILIAGTLTALGVIGGILWRYVLRPTSKFLGDIKALLEFVALELRHNGGSTIKDAIARTERGVTSVNKKIDIVGARQVALLNLEKTAIWQTDEHGSFITVNPAMARLAGRMPDEFEGMGWKTLIHPAHRAEVAASWRSAVADKRDFEFEFRFVNGVEVQVSGERMFAPSGELIGWIGDCRKV